MDLTVLDQGVSAEYENRWVFEISSEIPNKVGGICTVLRSKAEESVKELGDQYCLLGIYTEDVVKIEVEVMEPSEAFYRDILQAMANSGIKVVHGRMLIESYPRVILFDIDSARWRLKEWKLDLWKIANIGVPEHDEMSNDAIIFGHLVSWFLEDFYKRVEKERGIPYIVAHFHEWPTGIGLILCRSRHLRIATVFTTHVTLLGQYLCSTKLNFYNNLDKINLDKEAGDRGIYHRYCIERASVHLCHIFTTVSYIISLEAEHLLKRKPDIITPNGLNIRKFRSDPQFTDLHKVAKEKIQKFIHGHFYGIYDFDLEKTLYLFIGGKYEFINLGVDILIEALSRLNSSLKKANSEITVIAFFIFPANTNNFNVETLKGQAIAKQLREIASEVESRIGSNLFENCLRGNFPDTDHLLNSEDIVKLKHGIYAAQRDTLPPICTHNMVDDECDPILSHLRKFCLFNYRDDRVKVIFYPEFLSSSSPLFGMDYEEFVRGCDIGVFPSCYEPWGFTLAECTAMGVPSVTTNLSGFGSFIAEYVSDPLAYGIYIIDRRFKSREESIKHLAEYLLDFTRLSGKQRVIQRCRTERIIDILDWKMLGVYYRKARQMALRKVHPGTFDKEIRVPEIKYVRLKFQLLSQTNLQPSTPVHSKSEIGKECTDAERQADSEKKK